MNYRYILIDKIRKTVKMIDTEGCQAATEDKHGIRCNNNYSLEFNNKDEDFKKLSKKYIKFKKL